MDEGGRVMTEHARPSRRRPPASSLPPKVSDGHVGRSGGRERRRIGYGASHEDSVSSMTPDPSSSGSTHEVAWTALG
jgi:hypothetical protein